MRDYSATELSYLQNRTGYKNQILLWVQPRDMVSDARIGMGFWTGDQDASFVIDGQARTYQGYGSLGAVDPIVMQSELVVRYQRLTLSPLHPGVASFLRGHDPFRAPAELHRASFDPVTDALIADPRRLWKGLVFQSPIATPPIGGEATSDISLASAAESLTHGMTTTRSDAAQKQRGGDRMFKYKDIKGTALYSWGA